ncbi:MAG: hypothetical protein AAF658_03645, partial [Myxococcota bacterium]
MVRHAVDRAATAGKSSGDVVRLGDHHALVAALNAESTTREPIKSALAASRNFVGCKGALVAYGRGVDDTKEPLVAGRGRIHVSILAADVNGR